jgi:excisionase family DNA binding protein
MDEVKGARPVSTTLPELLTAREVGAVLRLTDTRVRQLARDGQIQAIRIGEKGVWRFRAEDVERFLEGKSP